MGEDSKNALLLGSVAANIFLVAFVLGRWSSPGLMPPPPMFPGREQAMQAPMMPQGQMPPNGMPGQMGGHGGQMGGPGMGLNGRGPGMPPPPGFGPQAVLNPQEMQETAAEMQKNFEKMQSIRADFAMKLQNGSVTKEEALKHFADIDSVMDGMKAKMQEKTAEKISTMSDDERRNFATHLLQSGPQPGQGMPPGQMPGQGMPPGQMPGQGMMPGQGPGPGQGMPGGPGGGFGGPPPNGGPMQGQLPPP